MNITRRTAATLLLAAVAGGALAQDKYPSKPVTIVVPQAPGDVKDRLAQAG